MAAVIQDHRQHLWANVPWSVFYFWVVPHLVTFHLADFIQFQVYNALHPISLIEFSVHLGLYDSEFTWTLNYEELLIYRPPGDFLEEAWWRLSTALVYDPHLTKATNLRSLALRYIHYILSHSLTGWGNSAGVVSYRNIDFLLSMVDGFHLSLLYELEVSIVH